jgi:hypothetical protein
VIQVQKHPSNVVGGTNDLYRDEFRVRDAAGSSWTTSRLHDSISIDTSFKTPMVDTKTWWERDPSNNIQSWGNAADTYLTINAGNVGIGITTPTSKLHINTTGLNTTIGSSNFADHWINFRDSSSLGISVGLNDSLNDGNGGYLIKGGTNKTISFVTNNSNNFDTITESDVNVHINTSGNVGIGTTTPTRKLHVNGGYNLIHNPTTELTTSVSGYGDIVTFGTGSLTAGLVYYLSSSNAWTLATNATLAGTSGLLAIALGGAPSNGMLVRGYVRNSAFPSVSIGGKLYLTTSGNITGTLPSGSGNFVRIVGYVLGQTNRQIYFNPSNDWIEL